MFVIALVNCYYDPNCWRELRESFSVKNQQPLGEVRLREMIRIRREKNDGQDGIEPQPKPTD